MLNSRGEFEPFKLLIGAVTALLILTIIVSTINYFDSLELDISTERFYTGVKNAVNQPNDSVIAVSGVVMDKGMIISTAGLAERTGLKEGCFSFETNNSSQYRIEGRSVTVLQKMQDDIYLKCRPGTDAAVCQIECSIGFGTVPS